MVNKIVKTFRSAYEGGYKSSRIFLIFYCLLFAVNAVLPSAALAQIKVEPGTTVRVGEEVYFDGSDVTIPGAALLDNGMVEGSYEWDFGDGYDLMKGSHYYNSDFGGTSTTHFYMRPGTYTATLNVTNSNSNNKIETVTITVEGMQPKLPPRPAVKPILELKFENNLDDTSPNGLTAQWKNGQGAFVRGIQGQAADLTGGSYIEVLDPVGILSGMNELTISMWAKKNEADVTGYLLDENGAYYMNIEEYDGLSRQINGYITTESGATTVHKRDEDIINKRWHHYAITYDGSLVKLFIDGIEFISPEGQAPKSITGKIQISVDNLLIGKKSDATKVFDGYIDEVKIYDKALTAKEVCVGFELWHADFHGHTAQYIYAQIPSEFTNDPTNKIKATVAGDGYSKEIYSKNNLQSEEKIFLNNSELPAGNYTLTVQILGSGDNLLDELTEKFSKPYDGVPEVGIDENNAIRVNGELFFPVVPWIMGDVSNGNKDIINALNGQSWYPGGSYTIATWEDYLNKADELNLKAIGPSGWEGAAYKNSDPNKITEYINALKDHNAKLMWMWGDEPLHHEIPSPVLRSWVYNSHKNDPHHIVTTNYAGYMWQPGDWKTGDWRYFLIRTQGYGYYYNANYFGGKRTPVVDVIGFDLYPIARESETMAGLINTINNFKEENYNLLPIHSFVASSKFDVGPTPTPEQVRMLTWVNVVHGVTGIKWMIVYGPIPLENRGVMTEFLYFITKLTPVVLGPEPNRSVQDNANVAGNRVDTMIREHDGDTYIFAVRVTEPEEPQTDDDITATFTVDGLTSDMTVIEPGEFSQSVAEYHGDSNLTPARQNFSFFLNNTPIIPGTLQVAGQYSDISKGYRIYLRDDGNGALYSIIPEVHLRSIRNASGTVNYQTGEVSVNFGEVKLDWVNWEPVSILPGKDMVVATHRPLRNDRVISHTGNTFTDTFAPNAVHIYWLSLSGQAAGAPVLATIGDKSVDENVTLTFTVNATDPNGEPITYSVWNLPSGATLDPLTGEFAWTPSYQQAGSYQVTFRASDGNSQDSETITITVNNVNRPPVIGAITDQSVNENDLLSIPVEASDPDGQALTYSISGLPAGAVFVSQTLTWTPSYDQAGAYPVTFTADDGQAQDSEAITITVINVNRTPVLAAINNQSVWADDPLTFTIDATDPDGDTVTYSTGTLPSGATFIGQDFDWTPSQGQMGSYDVTFIASDGQLQDSQTVTITVDVDSLAPTVTNSLPTTGSIQVPLNNLITLNIADAGKGVNANSVKIKVKTNSNPNNNTIYFGDTDYYTSPYGDCRRLGTKADYRFVYQSTNEMFYYDQTVTITVNAIDLAGNIMDEYSYSFATEMHSFGQNKQVNSGLSNNDRPVTVCDSSGNIWTAWHTGSIGNRDIYVSKLAAGEENFGGTVQLTDNTNDQCNSAVALDSNDKLYVVWQDNREGDWDIYVSTSVDGISWSTETRVNDPNNGNQVNPAIVIDGQSANQAHVVWQDDRAGNQDICIATSSDGFATKTVSRITTDSFDQVEPAVTADADNTIYVVWTDGRNGSNDIYGAASNNPWTNVAIVSNANNQSSPTIAAESVGSILHLLWVDDTLGDKDIYYASSDGLPGSPLIGSSIIDDTSGADQLDPAIAVTGSTGNNLKVFACWQDWRNTDTDLYFAELSAGSGTNVFVGDGGSNTYQGEPVIGIDEYSHPYLIWADNRSTNTEIYYAGSTFVEPVALASELVAASAPSSTTVGADPQAITTVDDVSIVVPAGACSYDVAITVTKIANPQTFAAPCLGGYDFGPSGIQFSQPVTITIPYFVSESNGSTLPYWYNSLTGTLSQQGITDVQDIVISPTLHALSFKTTHFTAFYLLGGGAAAVLGGGGGGGCSVSAGGEGNMVEFALPYIGLVVVMAILKVRDARERKARST